MVVVEVGCVFASGKGPLAALAASLAGSLVSGTLAILLANESDVSCLLQIRDTTSDRSGSKNVKSTAFLQCDGTLIRLGSSCRTALE